MSGITGTYHVPLSTSVMVVAVACIVLAVLLLLCVSVWTQASAGTPVNTFHVQMVSTKSLKNKFTVFFSQFVSK